MKYSIIVPVYNAEKYLSKCLTSLITQSYNNIEIIIVNDGSTDKSHQIIKQFQEKDSRFKIINQPNSGVSVARNNGLRECTGDYILFVDSDDYINKDTIKECNKIITEKNVDILAFTYYKRVGKIKRLYKLNVPTEEILYKDKYKEQLYNFILNTNDFCNVTTKVIRAKIAKAISFNPKLVIAEDFLFFTKCFLNSNSIYFTNKGFYNYVYNPISVTHLYDKKKNLIKLENSVKAFEEIKKMIQYSTFSNGKSCEKEKALVSSAILEGVKNLKFGSFCEYINYLLSNKSIKQQVERVKEDLNQNILKLMDFNKFVFFKTKIRINITDKIKKIIYILSGSR